MIAGVDNKHMTFLIRDIDFIKPVFLENINNILNSGEVPNLFNREEKESIANSMKDHKGVQNMSSAERFQ